MTEIVIKGMQQRSAIVRWRNEWYHLDLQTSKFEHETTIRFCRLTDHVLALVPVRQSTVNSSTKIEKEKKQDLMTSHLLLPAGACFHLSSTDSDLFTKPRFVQMSIEAEIRQKVSCSDLSVRSA